jgi:SAM-dependent methyltransferase
LDIGCGLGDFTEQLRLVNLNNDFYGMDISENAVKGGLKKYPQIKFKQGALPNVTWDKSFDGVMAMECVNYLKGDERDVTFKNIYDALKPGGWFFFTTAVYQPETYFYEKEAFDRIQNAGFNIQKSQFNYANIYYAIEKYFVKVLFHHRDITNNNLFEKNDLTAREKKVKRLISRPFIGAIYRGLVGVLAWFSRGFVKSKILVNMFQGIGKISGRRGKSHLFILAKKEA